MAGVCKACSLKRNLCLAYQNVVGSIKELWTSSGCLRSAGYDKINIADIAGNRAYLFTYSALLRVAIVVKTVGVEGWLNMDEEKEALNYCLRFSQRAYDQELERQKSMMCKAEYLLKYLTLLSAAINIVVSVVSKMSTIDTTGILFWALYILMLAAGGVGIISTLLVQRPRRIKQFSLGSEELTRIKDDPVKYSTECGRVYQEILWSDIVTRRMRENNTRALKWIVLAYVCVVVMVVSFGGFVTYVLLVA